MKLELELDNGKYTYIHNEFVHHALRYGELWRDLAGDNLIYYMGCEIERLQNVFVALDEACIGTECMVLDSENPRKSINDLICWNVEVALDPSVSRPQAIFALEQRVGGIEDAYRVVRDVLRSEKYAQKGLLTIGDFAVELANHVAELEKQIKKLKGGAPYVSQQCWRENDA